MMIIIIIIELFSYDHISLSCGLAYIQAQTSNYTRGTSFSHVIVFFWKTYMFLTTLQVEYRCLFCPDVFTDELTLYSHTRAHEQHYSTQRLCPGDRGSAQAHVQTAVPDTTCPEDQRLSAADVTPTVVEAESARKGIESETAKKSIEMTERRDIAVKKLAAPLFNSKKASILRRLSAGMCN